MKCNRVYIQLSAYLGETLDSVQKTELEQHLEECTACKRAISRLNKTESLLKQGKVQEPNPFFTNRVMDNIRTLKNKENIMPDLKTRYITPVIKTVSIAAAVFAGIILGSNLNNQGNSNYTRTDYLQALSESHYLLDTDYTLENMFLTDEGGEEE